jgi:hypothetical protein
VRRALGAVHVAEAQRAIGARDISDVLGVPVLATIPVRAPIARAVDAGVLAVRPPEALVRGIARVVGALPLPSARGRAA